MNATLTMSIQVPRLGPVQPFKLGAWTKEHSVYIALPCLTVELLHCFGADEEIRHLGLKLIKIADAMKEEKDGKPTDL